MEPEKLEIYLMILKTLEGSPFDKITKELRQEMEIHVNETRLDFLGNKHKIDLSTLLKRFPNINSLTLENICKNLKFHLDQIMPPSICGDARTFLGTGQLSLLRNPMALHKDQVMHATKALLATQNHFSPAYDSFSLNMVDHINARKLRGPVCMRRTMPAEIHGRIHLHRRLLGHLSSVYCVCFDQTGQFIFTGADDHLIKIWSSRDGRLLRTLRGHDGQITDMSVNYENRLLASAGIDKIIRIWDLKTSKLLDNLSAHHATVTSVKFAPYNRHGKDRYLISTSNDGSVIFWIYDVDKFGFKKLKKFQERNRPGGQIVCSSFSTGGSFLACGSSDNYIHVYGFHPDMGPYWISELGLHTDNVDSIQFSNQGFKFMTGSQDGTAAIWSYRNSTWVSKRLDMNTQLESNSSAQLTERQSKPVKVLIVQWSRDDKYVMTSLSDFSIKVWNSQTGELVHVLKEHKDSVYLIESHPTDPRIVASASHDGSMIIWDIERAKVIRRFKLTSESLERNDEFYDTSIFDMKWSPDGNMLVTTDSHGYLSIYGNGSPDPYKDLPSQMFFHTDYRPLIRDMRNFVLDDQSHVAPHLMPKPMLVDMNGNPHPPRYQRFVNDYSGDRYVIPPLTDRQLNAIAENITNHSRQEDDEYLAEKNSSSDDLRMISGPSGMGPHSSRYGNQSNSSRYNTRYSTRSSFQSARTNFLNRSRRTTSSVRYYEDDAEEEDVPGYRQSSSRASRRRRRRAARLRQLRNNNETHSDSSTEEEEEEEEEEEDEEDDVGVEEEEEAEVDGEESDDETETEIESNDETVIDSDATEIDEAPSASTTPRRRQNARRSLPVMTPLKRSTRSTRAIPPQHWEESQGRGVRRCSARLRDRKRFRRS